MRAVTRRELLRMTLMGCAGAALAACTPKSAPEVEPTAAGQQASATQPPAPTAVPAPSKPVTITFVESWFGIPQYAEVLEPVTAAISQKMQDEGLNINLRSMVLDDHETKYPTLYASGADFTMAYDAPWYKMNSLRDDGSLLPLEGLLDEYGPVTKEHITEEIYKFNFMRGHLYGIPAAYYYSGTGGVILREDLRLKYDVPAPTSAEGLPSLEPFLKAIRDNEPDLIPLGITSAGNTPGGDPYRTTHRWTPGGLNAIGMQIADVFEDPKYYDDESFEDIAASVSLCRDWWEKGYVNKEDLPDTSRTEGVGTTLFVPGKVAAWLENEPDFKYVEFGKQLKGNFPDAEAKGYDLTGMRAGLIKGLGALMQWNFVVFNAGAPKEQQIAGIQYFNWLHGSQDNMDLWLMGIDGVNYEKEEGLRFSEVAGADPTRNYRRMWYVSGCSGRFQRIPIDLPKDAEDTLSFFSSRENWVFNPYEAYEPDTKVLEIELSTLQAAFPEAVYSMRTGQKPADESIAFFKQTMDAAGRQDVKAKLQKQFDDWLAENA